MAGAILTNSGMCSCVAGNLGFEAGAGGGAGGGVGSFVGDAVLDSGSSSAAMALGCGEPWRLRRKFGCGEPGILPMLLRRLIQFLELPLPVSHVLCASR
jgi:hypothetical protein